MSLFARSLSLSITHPTKPLAPPRSFRNAVLWNVCFARWCVRRLGVRPRGAAVLAPLRLQGLRKVSEAHNGTHPRRSDHGADGAAADRRANRRSAARARSGQRDVVSSRRALRWQGRCSVRPHRHAVARSESEARCVHTRHRLGWHKLRGRPDRVRCAARRCRDGKVEAAGCQKPHRRYRRRPRR